MKEVTAILMTWEEFDDLVSFISNGEAGIANESGEWFYVSTEKYNIYEIDDDLSIHFERKVKNVLIDLSEEDDCVVIVLE